MNRCFLIGNLTDDPEVRYTQSGVAVTSFSIAINNGKDDRGKDRDPTYLDINAWDKLGENVAEYCRKGNKVAVEGVIQVDKWEDKDGAKRKTWRIRAFSVEFLTPKTRDEDDDAPRGRRDDRRDDRPRSRDESRDRRPSRPRVDSELDDLPF